MPKQALDATLKSVDSASAFPPPPSPISNGAQIK